MTSLRSSRGAITLALAILLPLVLATGSLLLATFLILRTQSRSLQLCRTSLLQVESQRLKAMERLFRMNKEARTLRRAREQAEADLAAARASLFPAAIAAAEAARATVVAMQLELAVRQKELIWRTNFETEVSLTRLKSKLIASGSADQRLFGGGGGPVIRSVQIHSSPLAVRATPLFNLSPDYVVQDGFETKQILSARWTHSPAHLLPSWLGFNTTADRARSIVSTCTSTAERKGRPWRARLAADKLPSN